MNCYNALLKLTQFKTILQIALNLGPSHRTFRKIFFFKVCWYGRYLRTLEKKHCAGSSRNFWDPHKYSNILDNCFNVVLLDALLTIEPEIFWYPEYQFRKEKLCHVDKNIKFNNLHLKNSCPSNFLKFIFTLWTFISLKDRTKWSIYRSKICLYRFMELIWCLGRIKCG